MAKTEIIHVAIEPEIKDVLEKLARKDGFSISLVIRQAIRSHLQILKEWPRKEKAQ